MSPPNYILLDVLFGLNSTSTLSVTLLLPNFNSYQSLSWRERSKRNLLHKGGTTTMICDTEKQIFISWNIFWHYFFVKRQEFIFSLGSNGDSMYFEGYYWLKGHPVHDIGSSKGHNSWNKRFSNAHLASKTFFCYIFKCFKFPMIQTENLQTLRLYEQVNNY